MNVISRSEAKLLGLEFYFTGKPCIRGHLSKRKVSDGACLPCKKIHQEEWAKRNREKVRKRVRKWYQENSERALEKNKEWLKKNRCYANKKRRSYRSERWRHPDYVAERVCRGFIYRLVRCGIEKKAKTFDSLGYSSSDFIKRIEETFSDDMDWSNYGEWHVDHIVPVSKFINDGITDPSVINALSNLQALWARDNLSKSNKVMNYAN